MTQQLITDLTKEVQIAIIQDYQEMVSRIESVLNTSLRRDEEGAKEAGTLDITFPEKRLRDEIRKALYEDE